MFMIKFLKSREDYFVEFKIIEGITTYHKNEFKWNPMIMLSTEFYQQLKPRLQIIIQDIIFNEFYQTFADVLEDCSIEFQRNLFAACKFDVLLGTHVEDKESSVCKVLKILEAN